MNTRSFFSFVTVIFVVFSIFHFTGCAPIKPGLEITEKETVEQEPLPVYEVIVEKENLRRSANGEKVNEALAGEKFSVLNRRGNWCEVIKSEENQGTDSTTTFWIWAPSLGFEKCNVISVKRLLGGKGVRNNYDSLKTFLGESTGQRRSPAGITRYIYTNSNEDGTTLFGTKRFSELILHVDDHSMVVLSAEIKLMPFQGAANELLGSLGFAEIKPSGSDFERVEYVRKFSGVDQLTMFRYRGDFKKFSHVVAEKFPTNSWRRNVKITDKKAELENGTLSVIMTLSNSSTGWAYAGPSIDVSIFEGSKSIGNWLLGPGAIRLEPGESREVKFPLPIDPSAIDKTKISLTAELKDVTIVPAKDI